MKFYAYVYRHPETSEPFYVGKGCKRRAWSHLKRTDGNHFPRRIAKLRRAGLEPLIEIIPALDEEHAYFLETCLISVIGRADLRTGPLLNETDGGDGIRGVTAEKKKSQTDKLIGRKHTAEARLKMSQAQIGKPGQAHSEETRAKMSASHKGVKRAPFTAEHKARIGAAQLTSKAVAEGRLKQAEKMRGRKEDPIAKAKRALAISAGHQRRRERIAQAGA